MPDVEFTFDRCRSILDRLRSAGYRFRSYDHALEPGDVLLRHDVDLSPERALRMARIEREWGLSATYFFLVSAPLYNPLQRPVREVIQEIAAIGHDVGLHFSTHQYWEAGRPPGEAEVTARVRDEWRVIESVVPDPVSTVSFHVPPPWAIRRTFDGFASTYEPRFFDEITYRADSEQRWRDEGLVLPDEGPLQVLMHPGLWGTEDATFVERVREAVIEADRRASEYVRTRHLEPETIRPRRAGPPEP